MKYLYIAICSLILALPTQAKDKQKIIDIEDEKADSALLLTVKASYSSPEIPDILIRAEFSYEDESGQKYYGKKVSTGYSYSIRGGTKWATYRFKADYSKLPEGKLTGYYIEVLDKESGEVEDDKGWKVSRAKHTEWQSLHSDASKLPVTQESL